MFKLTQLGNIDDWLRVAYEVAVSHIVYRSLDQATMESCVRLHKVLQSYVSVNGTYFENGVSLLRFIYPYSARKQIYCSVIS